MVAFQLLSRTFDDVLSDLGTSFKISFPLLIGLAFVVAGFVAFAAYTTLAGTPSGVVQADGTVMYDLSGAALGVLFTVLAVGLPLVGFCFCSTAVAWHRYVMLEERPKHWLPIGHGGLTWRYFRRSFLLFLLIVLLLIFSSVAAGYWLDTYPDGSAYLDVFAFPDPLTLKNFGIAMAFSFIVGGVILRLSVVLPALAVDRQIGFSAAWKATSSGGSGELFGLVSVLMMLAFGVMDLAAAYLPDFGFTIFLTIWIQIIVGIGILTRLYMHVLQSPAGRSL
jgi:F0F1-type ATP synthase assembly protein I